MKKEEYTELLKKMTYNEDGEGVIDGKTIRELEREAMGNYYNSFLAKGDLQAPKRKSKICALINRITHFLHCKWKWGTEKVKWILSKISDFLEIMLGIFFLVLFFLIYKHLKGTIDENDASLLGGLIAGFGAIAAILLSISFSKRSGEKSLESAVSPYFILKKLMEPPEIYEARELIPSEDTFKGWRPFDFTTIKDNKRTLVRNGIAYLRLTNIGLGPAKNIKISVENCGNLFLYKDYLQKDASMDIVLNFNNPGEDQTTNITVSCESIRNKKYEQVFPAWITWHLDRTNFTLFG